MTALALPLAAFVLDALATGLVLTALGLALRPGLRRLHPLLQADLALVLFLLAVAAPFLARPAPPPRPAPVLPAPAPTLPVPTEEAAPPPSVLWGARGTRCGRAPDRGSGGGASAPAEVAPPSRRSLGLGP